MTGLSMAKFEPSRYIVFAVSSVSATMFRSRKNFKYRKASSGWSITEFIDDAAA